MSILRADYKFTPDWYTISCHLYKLQFIIYIYGKRWLE